MTKADLPVVTKIEADCQTHPWTLLQFLDGFNAGHQGWVVCRQYEEREMIVGFAIVTSVLEKDLVKYLCQACISKTGSRTNTAGIPFAAG